MNTHTQQVSSTPTTTPVWPVLAAVGAGTSIVLTAMGTFFDLAHNDTGEPDPFIEYLPIVGFIAVATALVFGLVVRKADQTNAATRALILSVVSFLGLAAFWAGLPAVLAAGSIACAVVDRQSGSFSRRSYAALSISTVVVGLALWLAIAG
jgi:hypothetical protein